MISSSEHYLCLKRSRCVKADTHTRPYASHATSIPHADFNNTVTDT